MTSRRDESGLSLVECLVTVAILGIAFVSLLGGLGTSIFASDIHRKQATAETVLRSFAEHVKTATYVPCASTGSYVGSFTPADSNFTPSVTQVQLWNPATSAFDGVCSSGSDAGLQRISLRVASNDSRAVETVQIGKRRP
jgi:prepilin-type N-terminal cleavage/methylation domain-containing protein